MKTRVLMTAGSWTEEIVTLLTGLGAGVHILAPGEKWEKAYRRATHVLIPGGADIHPREYDERNLWANPSAPERDAIELPLARQALTDAKPLMGICRGHQVITVAAGGSLHQDIERNLGVAHTARQHGIRVLPRSRLGRLTGSAAWVNSYHHQAVKRVPAGWRVVAESLDGMVVEAIEHPRLPVLSVQWHPEVLGDWELFEMFLGSAGL
jgi:putative glutamine amidotransferase